LLICLILESNNSIREEGSDIFGGLISYLIVICEMTIHLIKTSLCLVIY